jgi:ATP-dependent DNA helicase RecG
MLLFNINPIEIDGKTILRLEVKAGSSTPYYYVNEGSKIAYVRLGNESVIAPSHILNELILKGKRLSFDAMSSKIKFTDVSVTLFEATFKQQTRSNIERPSDYLSFGLIDEDMQLTNAGVLLSDQCPILQSRIFCTRWNGLDKGSIFDDAIDDKEYKGNLISLLENGITFIKNNSKVMWKKTPAGRDEKPDYPERSVFEAMVNALIHRDYMILGSEVHIDMYDNRLEITSPGGMLDGKRIQEVDILHVPSSRRNPIISDVFHRLKFMERRGSGLKKILKEYEAENSPLFYSDQQYFTVTLINKNYGTKKTIERTTQRTTQKTTQKTEERILALITQNPTITQNDIATQLGDITPSGVKYNLKKLKRKGLINRIGADNGGYWVIIDVLQENEE